MSKCHNNESIIFNNLEKILNTMPLVNHLKVHSVYNVTVTSNWHVKTRVKDDFFIVFIKNGKGKYIINGIEEKIEKNKIIFISNGIPHSIYADSIEPPSFISVHFGLCSNNLNKPIDIINQVFSFAFNCENAEKFKLLFEDIFKFSNNSSNKKINNMSSGLLQYLFTQIYLWYSAGGTNSENVIKKLQHIKDMMDNNPLIELTTEQMAQRIGFCRKYFSSLFKNQYGKTPKEYQVACRINYSKLILEAKDLTIKEVAHICKYSDQYAFSKQFKKVTGCSPNSFRAKLQ